MKAKLFCRQFGLTLLGLILVVASVPGQHSPQDHSKHQSQSPPAKQAPATKDQKPAPHEGHQPAEPNEKQKKPEAVDQKHQHPPESVRPDRPAPESPAPDIHVDTTGRGHAPSPAPALNAAGEFLMEQASGTGINPPSSPMEMFSVRAGDWHLMFHGQLFLNSLQQTGPRGGDKVFATNWVMGMAERPVGRRGSFMFRTMLSLEPATISKRRYPLLFQTGETAFGRAITDGQHPHDLFMELSLQYARRLGEKTTVNFYAAPIGDPALARLCTSVEKRKGQGPISL